MSIDKIIKLFLLIVFFLFSIIGSYFYDDGDQLKYIKYYKIINGLNLVESFYSHKAIIGSSEPVYFILSWVSSNLQIEKIVFISLSNTILFFFYTKLMEKWRVSLYIYYPILFSNFYFLELYFAAERLKFSFIFIALFLIGIKSKRRQIIYITLSIISHLQQIIIFGAILTGILFEKFYRIILSGSFKLSSILSGISIIFFILFIFGFLGDHVLQKLGFYLENSSGGLTQTWKAFLFYFLSLVYSNERIRTTVYFMVIISLVFIVGPERINMIAYFIFLYYGLRYKNGINMGIIITSLYFSFKSIGFISNVIETGQGF